MCTELTNYGLLRLFFGLLMYIKKIIHIQKQTSKVMERRNGLHKAFVLMMAFFVAVLCFTSSCGKYEAETSTRSQDDPATPVEGGLAYETSLDHYLDSALKTKVSDQMTATLTVWRTEDGVKTDKVFENTEHPRLDAHSELARTDYTITRPQLDIRPYAERIARAPESKDSEGHVVELDTVIHNYAEGQIMTVPVKITNHTVEYDKTVFYYPSVTLVRADFVHLKNTEITPKTRATYVAGVYNTEYKVNLILQEKNKANPKTFTLPVYAYTTRSILEEDSIVKKVAENKTRELLDSLREDCSFEEVTTWASGQQTRERINIILYHKVDKIAPYKKEVKNFEHKLAFVNGIAQGAEEQNRTEGQWTVWRKTDKYTANIENGVVADRVVTDYPLMHERATYKDDYLEVSFDYEEYRVNETATTVSSLASDRSGYTEALLDNRIMTTYIAYQQPVNEQVYLYKPDKKAKDYKFENPTLTVYRDSVVGDIDFITIFDDGTQDKIHDHISAPRSLVVTTNWESYQKVASQITSDAVGISLTSSEDVTNGYWKYSKQTRKLSTDATLYDGSIQQNGWNAVVPNAFRYTREGKTHTFDNIAFSAKQMGGTLTADGEKDGYSLHKYADAIDVVYGKDVQRSVAPGLVKVSNNTVKGYEIRNKLLRIEPDRVVVSLDFITQFANGTESKDPVTKEFPRSLTVTSNWTAYEKNQAETTGEPTATLAKSESKEEDEWKWTEETRNISANVQLNESQQTNTWISVDPNNIKFTRQGISADFGTFTFTTSKVSSAATLASSDAQTENYDYANIISTRLGNSTASDMQNSTAPGKIVVNKGKSVIKHEIRNPKLTVENDYVRATLTYATLFSDGTETTENVSKDFPRSLNPYTSWSSSETSADEQTGSASVNLKSSEAKTDGDWSYTSETRDITTTVTLASGKQTNGWTSIDPNSIVYSRDGEKYEFSKLNFSAKEAGHSVNLSSETATVKTYAYTDKINVDYGNNTKASSAPGTITVKKEVTEVDYEISNPKITVNKSNVTTSLTWTTIYSDGTKKSEEVSKSFARSFKVLTNWSSKEDDNSQSTSSATVSLTNSSKQTDGDWSYVRETRNISTTAKLKGSSQENRWESIDPNSIVFSRKGKTHDFGTLSFSAAETGATVTKKSSTNTETVYNYKDNITVSYGSNSFDSSAPGSISVKQEVTVTDYEISNPKITVNKSNVTASLTWTTIYSDGTKKSEDISKSFARSFKVLTNWSSQEDDNSQSTSSATVSLTNSSNQTDGNWSYVRETRNISTTAKLKGSSQENRWESTDPNSIVFSRNGKTHDFGTLSFNAYETGATVTKKSENDDKTVYSYKDNISVAYGSNSFDSSAPGAITVNKPWNPDFSDKFTGATVTATLNETHSTWMYVVSVHFTNGTLPILIRQGASAPEVNMSYKDPDTNSNFNSAYYVGGKWINAIADDVNSDNYMVWKDTNNTPVGMLVYPTATLWGWDDGHTSGGHPTVFTDKYSVKLSNNKTVLTIYDGSGRVFATYKCPK